MERITWTTEKRKIAKLNPAEYNPRQAGDKEYKDLETSLTRFNLVDPIVINKNNTIIGNHRLMCGDSTQREAVERLMAGNRAESEETKCIKKAE